MPAAATTARSAGWPISRHYRVTLADALEAHEEALRFGGRPGISNLGLIESAIASPYHRRPIAEKAAGLLRSVACNHAFVDGNKRTSVILTDLLLYRSGYRLDDEAAEEIDAIVVAVVTREMGFDALVSWLKDHIEKLR